MSEGWLVLAAVVSAFLVMIVATVGMGKIGCDDLGDNSAVKTKYSWISGCYVHVDGRWIPRDSWRGEYEQRKGEQ